MIGVSGTIDIDLISTKSRFDSVLDLSAIADQNKINPDYFLKKTNFDIFKVAGQKIASFINEDKRI